MTESGKKFSLSKAMLLLLDVFTALLAVQIIFAFRTSETVIAFSRKAGALYKTEAFIFYAIAALAIPIFFRLNNLYKYRVIAATTDQIPLIIKSYFPLGMVLLFLLFFLQDRVLATSARGFWLGFEILGIVLLSIERAIIAALVRRRKFLRDEVVAKKVLIVGAGHAGESFALRILNDPELGIEKAYFLDDDETKFGTTLLSFPILGRTNDVMRSAIDVGADEIYITINAISRERLLEIIEECKKTKLPVKVFSRHFRIVQGEMEPSVLSGALELPSQMTIHPGLVAKRIMDVLAGTMAFLVALIPGVFIALLIKLTSRGPVLYTSYRIGKGGKPFKMFKFRTMRLNDESEHREIAEQRLKEGVHMGKPENDPRITPIGRFLRKYSIDEAPQILNVLRGEMSLVGPRPCLDYELQYFEDWHKRRFLVLPGLTGLWQVTGRQIDGLSLHDAMILDVFYAENFTIWLDIKILLKTIPVVLFGKSKV
ncbi:MAG: sugar transferase [Candidatus Kapabacteria bacterium]|jgi:exopolysaccharide biosynthesis polyprenyl glycosylphosphotransferase|nr:sugar transferase [Candidatus Kapabacteria bacterium]